MKTMSRRNFLNLAFKASVAIPATILAAKLLTSCSDMEVNEKVTKRITTEKPLKIGNLEIWLENIYYRDTEEGRTYISPRIYFKRDNGTKILFRNKDGSNTIYTYLEEHGATTITLNKGTPNEEKYSIKAEPRSCFMTHTASGFMVASVILEVEYSVKKK